MNWQDEQHIALLRKAYADDLDRLPMTKRQHLKMKAYLRDVFEAGRAEGVKAGRAKPALLIGRVESRRTRWFWRAIEYAASFTTLAGIWIGSTTVSGSILYLAAGVLFVAISIKHRLHGLQLLNFPALAIESYNLWAALA